MSLAAVIVTVSFTSLRPFAYPCNTLSVQLSVIHFTISFPALLTFTAWFMVPLSCPYRHEVNYV